MMSSELLTKDLNPQQAGAVNCLKGPVLILAGAGSGKTRVLTHRLANLVASELAHPSEILAVTFTNKAAREMQSRTIELLNKIGFPHFGRLWISTFHSSCTRILRSHIELMGYKNNFVIYDSDEQLAMIKKVLKALNINDKMYPPKNFQSRISNAKMLGLTASEFEKQAKNFLEQKNAQVYSRYEEDMKRSNTLDFDDLLLITYRLFKTQPQVLAQYQNIFKYIMVDEYQDTNHIQYLLVQLLANQHRNICVVGDEDQSIYSWRGADIKNILDFEKDFNEAQVFKLEQNYRSTKNIVSAASAVIKNNSERKDKTLFTSNTNGEPIQLKQETNEYEEARFVAKTILAQMSDPKGQPRSYKDFAVFYRTNAQSRVLEEQMRLNSIPYRLVGGVRFFDRMEIKDVLGYLKLCLNPTDDIAFKRVINTPTRGIGKTTMDQIEEFANANRLCLFIAAYEVVHRRMFNATTTSKIRNFLDLIEELQSQSQKHPLTDFYTIVLDRTEYLKRLKAEDSPEALARVENLNEFQNAITQFTEERGNEASLLSFLEEMALVQDSDDLKENDNTVTLMTLHISKGLEFPVVFIVGMEEGIFPSSRGLDESGDQALQEERRLAYVGMTRAREELFLLCTLSRRVWGQEQYNQPSRFLQEIPSEYIQTATAQFTPASSFVDRHSAAYKTNKKWGDDHQNFPDYEPSDDKMSDRSIKRSGNNEHGSGNGNGSGSGMASDVLAFSRGGNKPRFATGSKIRHPTFGIGQIYSTEGSGDNEKVSVVFSDNTIKKFIVKYARLERL